MGKKQQWEAFPYPDKAYEYAGGALKKAWSVLHAGDCEPYPESAALQDAWRAFHRGDFQTAAELGLAQGSAGWSLANKATCIYANYLEEDEARQLALFQEVAKRCEAQQKEDPANANAWYWHAYALGRYSQAISVVKALAQGLGGKIKDSLTRALSLEPKHADAHIALGAYHAEVIDKVGGMVGSLTYGASKDEAVKHFESALNLNPGSAIARMEYANGLVMMYGQKRMKEAEKLYQAAADTQPADAMERLDVELAKEELED